MKNKIENKNISQFFTDTTFKIIVLSFIPSKKIYNFYEKLKNKYYNNNFKNFLTNHVKTYFKNKSLNDKMQNYYNFINGQKNKNINNNILFFTNNIIESTNKTIILHFIKSKKTFWNFHVKNFLIY